MAKLRVKIPKADTYMDVEINNISDAMFAKVIEAGLRFYLNSGMATLGPTSNLTGSKFKRLQATALAKAEANLAELCAK